MEMVSEITARLENKPGRLAKICSALAQEKVDILPSSSSRLTSMLAFSMVAT